MKKRYGQSDIAAVAKLVATELSAHTDKATVIGLSGELGAGKTTLVQELAKVLGVVENVASPTFVIAKYYTVPSEAFDQMVHIDAYRIESTEELGALGWDDLLVQPRTLVVIEWPERIGVALPPHIKRYMIEHRNEEREIYSL